MWADEKGRLIPVNNGWDFRLTLIKQTKEGDSCVSNTTTDIQIHTNY